MDRRPTDADDDLTVAPPDDHRDEASRSSNRPAGPDFGAGDHGPGDKDSLGRDADDDVPA